jgi:hypothetical protein
MTLQLLHSEFPYILYEENLIFFFISEETKYPLVQLVNLIMGPCASCFCGGGPHIIFLLLPASFCNEILSSMEYLKTLAIYQVTL